jgi:hypothetical protein
MLLKTPAIGVDGTILVRKIGLVQVAASTGSIDSPPGSDDLKDEAKGLRRISWISFWLQLALSIVSAIVLFFTASTASRGSPPPPPPFPPYPKPPSFPFHQSCQSHACAWEDIDYPQDFLNLANVPYSSMNLIVATPSHGN